MARDSKSKGGDKKAERAPSKPQKPAAPLPSPSVLSRHEGSMVERSSRGFSYGEVQGSGMAVVTARNWGVPLDTRRRSVLEGNVHALKGWYSKSKGASEAKKVEAELVKIGREAEGEVRKGVAKARKEAVRAEKEVEKLEKEAVEKVEAPIKKRRAKKAAKDSEEASSQEQAKDE